ncbi:MAG TPA: response regulator [Candidatus Omnitrophota bacterium]|nr:response regulator [Candidatus Omnitrophota bacterium]HRZ14787.1 response regulator [Candidatus Omnitrophota bacterium]
MAKKILVIDDDVLVTKSIVKYLKVKGYEVESADSGKTAIALAQRLAFDLIVADIRMPEMNGLEAIRKIREINSLQGRAHPQEIIITGYASDDLQKEAQEMQVAAYIYKPFDIGEFMAAVERCLT